VIWLIVIFLGLPAIAILALTIESVSHHKFLERLNQPISDDDIFKEQHIMELEKQEFGRYMLTHERQTPAYKAWLRTVQDETTQT